MRCGAAIVALGLVAGVMARAGSADAQGASVTAATPEQKAQAKEAFQRGNQAFGDGRHADALAAFEASYAIVASPNTRLMIGRTLARLERRDEARAALQKAVSEAEQAAAAEPKYQQTAAAARDELAELERKAKKQPPAAPAPPPPAPPPPPPAPAPEGEPFPRLTVGIVSAGVGVVGFGLSGLFGGLALGKKHELDDACPNLRCPAGLQETVDDGETLQTASNAMFVVGAIGVAAGGVLITWHFLDDGESASALVVGPGSVGVKGAF